MSLAHRWPQPSPPKVFSHIIITFWFQNSIFHRKIRSSLHSFFLPRMMVEMKRKSFIFFYLNFLKFIFNWKIIAL